MARFYASRINYDLNRIDEVPAYFRKAVIKYIESM